MVYFSEKNWSTIHESSTESCAGLTTLNVLTFIYVFACLAPRVWVWGAWSDFALRCRALLCGVFARLHLALFLAGGPYLPSLSVNLCMYCCVKGLEFTVVVNLKMMLPLLACAPCGVDATNTMQWRMPSCTDALRTWTIAGGRTLKPYSSGGLLSPLPRCASEQICP
jgi:hypothetical protein